MAEISEEDLRSLRTQNLREAMVRSALAGYLHQNLKNNHGVLVPAERIYAAITKYAEAMDSRLAELEIELHKRGVKPT